VFLNNQARKRALYGPFNTIKSLCNILTSGFLRFVLRYKEKIKGSNEYILMTSYLSVLDMFSLAGRRIAGSFESKHSQLRIINRRKRALRVAKENSSLLWMSRECMKKCAWWMLGERVKGRAKFSDSRYWAQTFYLFLWMPM